MKDPMKLWKDIAYRFALQSKCQSRQVGAIIVNPAGHLIGQGWNGAPDGSDCSSCKRCTRSGLRHDITKALGNNNPLAGINLEAALCAHAEANAIGHCARAGIKTLGCTLVCTTRPCSECAKLVVAAGIIAVSYFEDYPREDDALEIFARAGVSVLKG